MKSSTLLLYEDEDIGRFSLLSMKDLIMFPLGLIVFKPEKIKSC